MAVTRIWKVYRIGGHRQRESFMKSHTYNFTKGNNVRVISVANADLTGTHEYSVVTITCSTAELCQKELDGQLSDGIFENSRTGVYANLNLGHMAH